MGCDASEEACERASKRGIKAVVSMQQLVKRLEKPCIVWLQTPPGAITNTIIRELSELLKEGDMVIDGGNSDFRDTKKTAEYLSEKNIHFMDIGVSGGVAGAKN
ncbi:NAD(P)-binding domain-containing protein, partial [Eggerthella lenta]|nr:NAD(P)-binding domain-containing protein [Eggerthella lenta]